MTLVSQVVTVLNSIGADLKSFGQRITGTETTLANLGTVGGQNLKTGSVTFATVNGQSVVGTGNISVQAYSAVLSDLAATAGSGLLRRTASLWSFDATDYQPLNAELTAASSLSGAGLVRRNVDGSWGVDATAYQQQDADLTAIGALNGTAGLLRKTATNTWVLDTAPYLTGNQTITFTGAVVGSGSTSVALSLAATGVNPGTYGSATQIPVVTVGSDGRVTDVTVVGVSTLLDDVQEYATSAAFPATGSSGTLYIAASNSHMYRWTGSAYFDLSGLPAGSAVYADRLTTPRTVTFSGAALGSFVFDGSGDAYCALTLADVVAAGEGMKLTYNTKGQIIGNAPVIASDIPDLSGIYVTQSGNTLPLANGAVTSVAQVANTGAHVIDSFAASSYLASELIVTLKSGSSVHALKLLVLQDGTTPYLTQYADLLNVEPLAAFDAYITAGVVYITATPVHSGTVIKAVATRVAA